MCVLNNDFISLVLENNSSSTSFDKLENAVFVGARKVYNPISRYQYYSGQIKAQLKWNIASPFFKVSAKPAKLMTCKSIEKRSLSVSNNSIMFLDSTYSENVRISKNENLFRKKNMTHYANQWPRENDHV